MTIAVTGASGKLGRGVVEALLRRGAGPIVAIVRDPSKVADLAEQGVEIRQASYDDAESYDRALAGVDRLLLVSGTDFDSRVAQHTTVIRAAERAGVQLIAYTSIPRATDNPMILAQEHRGTEAVLRVRSPGGQPRQTRGAHARNSLNAATRSPSGGRSPA